MIEKAQKLGIIIGSNKLNIDALDTYNLQESISEYGNAHVWIGKRSIAIYRHGKDHNTPPHKINHHANILAFKKRGVEKIVSFTSVGSLKLELEPSNILIPHDYINYGQIPTYFDNEIKHVVPGLEDEFRFEIIEKLKNNLKNLKSNGIYLQTQGPRIETKAEIQMFKNFADVMGMTMASEATLAKELEIRYVNISIVDNYCHGLIDDSLVTEKILENQTRNAKILEKVAAKILNK